MTSWTVGELLDTASRLKLERDELLGALKRRMCCTDDAETLMMCGIHKPGTKDESVPITHGPGGHAVGTFTVNAPPDYGQHPADLVEAWEGGE